VVVSTERPSATTTGIGAYEGRDDATCSVGRSGSSTAAAEGSLRARMVNRGAIGGIAPRVEPTRR
jgi:hypothetical protein